MSDDELHRAANTCLYDANLTVSGELPSSIRQIIEHKVWKARGCKSFAEYALNQTSDGLNINNDPKLWLLKESLDYMGKHVKEWTEVAAKVDEVVKVQIAEEGVRVRDFEGNSLRKLASSVMPSVTKITYLPSRSGRDHDLIRLRRDHPELFGRVAAGKVKVRDAMRESGIHRVDMVKTTIAAFRRIDKKDLKRFIERREEGHI